MTYWYRCALVLNPAAWVTQAVAAAVEEESPDTSEAQCVNDAEWMAIHRYGPRPGEWVRVALCERCVSIYREHTNPTIILAIRPIVDEDAVPDWHRAP